MKNFLIWLVIMVMLILVEGWIPKTERAWLKIDAFFAVLWLVIGALWALRGFYRFMTK